MAWCLPAHKGLSPRSLLSLKLQTTESLAALTDELNQAIGLTFSQLPFSLNYNMHLPPSPHTF